MSIELDWDTVTSGPDGAALAETIRNFIHERFQAVTLPRFIKSVKVHTFDFGSVAPEIELKDICDPLADFYEEDIDDEDQPEEDGELNSGSSKVDRDKRKTSSRDDELSGSNNNASSARLGIDPRSSSRPPLYSPDYGGHFFGTHTPGIAGGTSNLNYFHSHLASGLSGTRTPLAAVAGAHLPHGWPDYGIQAAGHRSGQHHQSPSASSGSPPSSKDPVQYAPGHGSVSTYSPSESRPPTQDGVLEDDDEQPATRFRERRVEDLQTVFRVRYSGDIKLSLTAEILLDYPMPSFVGIPLKLNITGLSFDGVAVLAYIRKKAHFCFLSHEDALNAIGPEDLDDPEGNSNGLKMGGLLQEIKVESEIGQRESGKQVLKNVSKVEKFVLEQVRRIFEDEFVYPSFWTFLV